MPNNAVIEKWTTALESGVYHQAKGKLRRVEEDEDGRNVGFCCLGVLCDLAVKEGVIDQDPGTYNGYVYYDGHEDELPPAVKAWAGLDSPNPKVEYRLTEGEKEWEDEAVETGVDSLAELNDTHGRTFEEIAQIVRENFL